MSRFTDDTVRGVVATDALIGTFASMDDPSLIQNRCFLYHLIGNGTGEWRVPVGGMGAVTDALARAAVEAGAEIVTGAGVSAISRRARRRRGRSGTTAPASAPSPGGACCPASRRGCCGSCSARARTPRPSPSASQLKINFLLDRLPRAQVRRRPRRSPSPAPCTSAEDYTQLEQAYAAAAARPAARPHAGRGLLPHLTDPSILGERAGSAHTLTYFGLHTPAGAVRRRPRARARWPARRALASLNAVPRRADRGLPRPRTPTAGPASRPRSRRTSRRDLAMPGGHIFHGDLEWPWAPNRARLETPAQQWGVQTEHDVVLLCGSGARRGGAVSGLGGHNAAQAVLARPVTGLPRFRPLVTTRVMFYSLHRMRH